MKTRRVSAWEEILHKGKVTPDKPVELIYCNSLDGDGDILSSRYTVVEIEVCRMGYHKQFASKEDYEKYSESKKVLREGHNKLIAARETGELAGKNLLLAEDEWLASARTYVDTWGVDFTPEDMREAITDKMQRGDEEGDMHWNHHIRSTTTFLKMGEVDRFKFEFEDWD